MALSLRGVKARYEVKEIIAKGGMGVVYKAYDKVMNRPVALKTLLDLTDSKAVKLFQKECEDLASLIHPNIVQIFDVGELEEEGGTKPYLVMPFLPGVTLDKLIRTSSARLTVDRSVDIFCQTCRGLFAAHEKGLIHRDLKPSNIFVMDDDSVQIIDFGVAHRVHSNKTVGRKGTLIYMSPEQVSMKALTPASDIFSLGVVCYETLTSRRPFERSTEDEVDDAIHNYVPPPVHELNPSVAVPISQAIHKAMAKNPLHRYRSAREFGEILQKALHNEPIELFNPARIRPRLERAREAYDKGDYEYASEILNELESEGHLDPEITELRDYIDRARVERRVKQLIETARSRMDEKEYQIALQKIDEVLQLDPKNTEALALKAKVDTRRTDQDIDGWLNIARTHIENRAFGPAREALRRILEFRPREPKATQLLSEVERLELSQQRARDQKEGLYRAAVEAERNGDISSALSKIERVLEIDKEAPEPSRTGTYQRLYDKVRSEYESLKGARAEAKRLLDDQKFAQAAAICKEYLAKYPGDMLFQALNFDIEEKHRQAVSARIAETDRRVEAEPDLDRRVSILEEAVRENPGEAHFERALQNARDKRDMVNTIVTRARNCEERGQFSEALTQWETLQTIYPRYPGLSIEVDRLNKRREQSRRQEAKARWVDQIERHLETTDFVRAGELAHMAEQEFPGDPEFAELERLAQQGLERHAEAQRLLVSGQEACAQSRLQDGLDALRHAYDLDNNNNQIRSVLVETLVEQGRRLIESDSRTAEQLLNQALELEPNHALATSLLRLFADQRKVEAIDRALAQARRLQTSGDFKQALEIIAEALVSYPKEERLLQVEASLRRSIQDLRRRDLEQAKRIAREVDSVADLDRERRAQYADRLDRYMTEYEEDEEFRTVVHSARRRLETVLGAELGEEGSAMAHAAVAGASATDGAAAEELLGPVSIVTPKPIRHPQSVRRAFEQVGGWGSSGMSAIRSLIRARSRKATFIATSSAISILLVIALGLYVAKVQRDNHKLIPIVDGTVDISTVPSGAAIYLNGIEVGTASPTVTIRRRPGTYDLEVRRSGYQPLPQKLEIGQGSMPPITLKMVPELATLHIFGSGEVSFDSDPQTEIKDGHFEKQLTVAEHDIHIAMSRTSQLSFKVRVDSDGLPAIYELRAREVTPLIVSNFGQFTKLYGTNKDPVPVPLSGQAIGNLGSEGLDLPFLPPNVYEVEIAEGKDAKKRNVDVSAGRTVTVLLEADPNVGGLLVQADQDDATIVLVYDGKEYRRKTTQNHHARFANVRVGSYTIQVSKDGFIDDSDKTVAVAKGVDTPVSFELRPKPKPGTLQVKTVPGADVLFDDRLLGQAPSDGIVQIPNVTIGAEHRIEARLKPYEARSTRVTVGDGETKPVDLMLTRSPGTVQIQKFPADATITYRKQGDASEHVATANQVSLPEGDYVFTGKADNFESRTTTAHLRAEENTTVDLILVPITEGIKPPPPDPMALWPKGTWDCPIRDWCKHTGEGFLGISRSGPSVIEFDTPLSTVGTIRKSRRLIWATNYLNATNYVQHEITEKALTIVKVANGKRGKPLTKSFTPSGSYTVRLEWRPDSITVKINGETIGEVTSTAPGEFAEGKFGFLGNKEVFILNFHLGSTN